MFREHPVMRDIWRATQADHALQRIDEEGCAFLTGLLSGAVKRVAPGAAPQSVAAFSQLMMTLIAGAVRHAITLKPKEGERVMALFKHMLPRKLPEPTLKNP
jgi:hypothetical protein